jgi:hypothetical protein
MFLEAVWFALAVRVFSHVDVKWHAHQKEKEHQQVCQLSQQPIRAKKPLFKLIISDYSACEACDVEEIPIPGGGPQGEKNSTSGFVHSAEVVVMAAS